MSKNVNEIMELYESEQYDEFLPYALQLYQKMKTSNFKNEYILQALANVFYVQKKYEDAWVMSSYCVEYFNTIENLENQYKIAQKLEKKDEESTILLKMYSVTLRPEYLNEYIKQNINRVEAIPDLFTILLKYKDRLENHFYSFLITILLYHAYGFLKYSNLLQQLYENDKDALDKAEKASTIEEQTVCFLYLLLPTLFHKNVEQEYERILKNIKDILNLKVIHQTEEIFLYYKNNFTYYYTYLGKNNKELYHLINLFINRIQISKKIELKQTNEKRIGFFSNFLFQNHSVSRDRLGVIKHLCHDSDFKVYIIHYEAKKERDVFFQRIMLDTSFHEILLTPNRNENIEIMKELGLDILVYPEIGMDLDAYFLAKLRLAPIQINTWGHSETSGMDTIDYYISSDYFETKNSHKNYTEKLIRLKSLSTYYYNNDFLLNYPFDEKISDIRLSYQLYDSYHIYGIFQTVFKYHPTLLSIVVSILEKDKDAFFVILIPKIYWNDFMNMISNQNSIRSRIHLVDHLKKVDYCNLLRSMDILIDSYPFGGCNTTLDSFNFDKIVISLPSSKLNGRFTYGFYKKMGILEPICHSTNEVVDKAIYYMKNKKERLKLEKRISDKKHLLFQEQDTLIDWNNLVRKLVYLPPLEVSKRQIVISRYKENIDYISIFENVVLYNKGDSIDYPFISLPNIGKCDHTYLYHIIENYDRLEDLTIFLPASVYHISYKRRLLRYLIETANMTNNKKTILIGKTHNYPDFTIEYYETSFKDNKTINNKCELSSIRPYGAWCEHFFGGNNGKSTYLGILAVTKEEILKHPIEFYKSLLDTVSSPNPEAGHYMERSYAIMFQDHIFLEY